ncbi:hypothetical protein JRO89_XS04G0137400 [Xanthoceras sorbifolium]|uniref:AB hydrolase-1 domain-containing protein n=1 Tax=Xanthoceras sorbifolium TaxID=99658 RepID=A0ABQ8I585_9ROSI|nr:hypothetical protein JRO89_XS04G0137400 [Xanthoceras sorbifolium]
MMSNKIVEALNVQVIGSGENSVMFGHGLGTDQSIWQRILPYFNNGTYRLILYDLACSGSVKPELFNFNKYATIDGYVDDMIDILTALGVHRCTFVGHSASAMTGILAAIRRPELFSKLILVGASPRLVNDVEYNGGAEEAQVGKIFAAMEADYAAWADSSAPVAVGADLPEAIQEYSRTLLNTRPDIASYALRTFVNTDLRGLLGHVRVPCHIVQTARDPSVPISAAGYLWRHLGGQTTFEILRTEGHLPHLTAPTLLGPAIQRALLQ